jgi:hypothetical protein
MKQIVIIIAFFMNAQNAFSQSIQLDFENLSTGINQHQNLLTSSNINYGTTFFPSVWDTSFGGYWVNGFAWSSETDSVTSGFANQYSTANGKGDSSNTYLVAYSTAMIKTPQHKPKKIAINNNAYAYWSMKNGDAFAKKFGGVTGTDPDFFIVTIYGYYNGVKTTDSINVYLADFRSSTPANDYILKQWIDVSLDTLGQTDSIEFVLQSTDNGAFGMNTPAYFCIDNYQYQLNPNTINEENNTFVFYPNPTTNFVNFDASIQNITIKTHLGQSINMPIENNKINFTNASTGIYFIQFEQNEKTYFQKIVKQ